MANNFSSTTAGEGQRNPRSMNMPTQQEIHTRIEAMGKEVWDAGEKAQKQARQVQSAEMDELKAACAAQGHLFKQSVYSLRPHERYCIVCGEAENAAKEVTSTNLSKGI